MPSGELARANTLLTPTIKLLRSVSGDQNFDIRRLLNFWFMSYHWLMLLDFGLDAPTVFIGDPAQSIPDFSQPIVYLPTNNLFVNDSLFQIYSSYIHNTLVPLVQQTDPAYNIPEFSPLTKDNHFQPFNTTLFRSYPCTERQLKGWGSVVVAVLAASYAILAGSYTVLISVLGWYQCRKDESGLIPLLY
jgi:hypothetical protein